MVVAEKKRALQRSTCSLGCAGRHFPFRHVVLICLVRGMLALGRPTAPAGTRLPRTYEHKIRSVGGPRFHCPGVLFPTTTVYHVVTNFALFEDFSSFLNLVHPAFCVNQGVSTSMRPTTPHAERGLVASRDVEGGYPRQTRTAQEARECRLLTIAIPTYSLLYRKRSMDRPLLVMSRSGLADLPLWPDLICL